VGCTLVTVAVEPLIEPEPPPEPSQCARSPKPDRRRNCALIDTAAESTGRPGDIATQSTADSHADAHRSRARQARVFSCCVPPLAPSVVLARLACSADRRWSHPYRLCRPPLGHGGQAGLIKVVEPSPAAIGRAQDREQASVGPCVKGWPGPKAEQVGLWAPWPPAKALISPVSPPDIEQPIGTSTGVVGDTGRLCRCRTERPVPRATLPPNNNTGGIAPRLFTFSVGAFPLAALNCTT